MRQPQAACACQPGSATWPGCATCLHQCCARVRAHRGPAKQQFHVLMLSRGGAGACPPRLFGQEPVLLPCAHPCLQTLRAMRQSVRDRRQAAAERVEPVQTETVVVESAHVMVIVVRQEAVEGFNAQVSPHAERSHFQRAVSCGQALQCLSSLMSLLGDWRAGAACGWPQPAKLCGGAKGSGACIASAALQFVQPVTQDSMLAQDTGRDWAPGRAWPWHGYHTPLHVQQDQGATPQFVCSQRRPCCQVCRETTQCHKLRCRSRGARLPPPAMRSARD